MDAFSLEGRVALVTGAGKGIGKGVARAFAAAGADVALVSRTAGDLEAVAAELQTAGRRALAFPADVSDLASLPAVVEQTVRDLDGLDVLVNCAGGGYHWHSFDDTSLEIVEEQFRFTVMSVYALVKAAAPHLLQRPGSSIINIGSVTVGTAARGHLAYETAKAALVQMTKSLAADLGPKVRVNIIHPGATETEALVAVMEEMAPEMIDGMQQMARMRRLGTPSDIGAAAVYLASAAGSYVTGFELTVAGGPVDEMNQMFPDL
jgi:7-alpha-hydroxysteroid dehydrogenase